MLTLVEFDWTSKLVCSVDGSPDNLKPLIQLKLHTNNSEDPLIYEFTPEQMKQFLDKL